MKVCSSCKSTYSDWIDFCFEDGSVLAVHSQAQPVDEAIDAPMPRHLRAQDAQETPQPKAGGRRRSLIGGAARENTGSPMDVPVAAVQESILDVPPPPATEVAAEAPSPAPMPSAWTGADIAARHAAPALPQPEPLRPVDVPVRKPANKAPPAPVVPAPVAVAPPPAAPPAQPARPAPEPKSAAPTPEPAGFAPPPAPREVEEEASPAKGTPILLFLGVGLVGLLALGGVGALVIVGLGVGGMTLTGGGQKEPANVAATHVPSVPAVAAPVEPEAVVEVPVAPPVPDEVVAAVQPEVAPALPVPDAVVDPVVPPPTPVETRPEVKAVVTPPKPDPIPPNPTTTTTGVAQQFTITVEGTPPGANVSVGGENKGKTPLTLQYPSGDYRIEVSKGGYSSEKRLISVRGAAQTVKYELWEETRVGKVFVAFAGREGQTLLVDGLPMGTLPASVDLTEGKHTFAVANGDGTQFSVSKDVVFNAAGRATVTQ